MTLELQKMKAGGGKRERVEEGTYMSRIGSVIDLGIQPQTDWKTGEPTESKPRLLLTWELPTEFITIENDDGNSEDFPRLISKEYTSSANERANIMKLIAVLKPKAMSAAELAGEPCMTSIGSTVTGNAKVTSCVKAPSGMDVPELSKPAIVFDFDNPSKEAFMSFPDWIKNKILDAENYTGFADSWVETEEAA